MIVLTRLGGRDIAVNPDLVERMHANPDTTLVLVDGTTIVVTDSVDDVIDRIVEYRARITARAHALAVEGSPVFPGGGNVIPLNGAPRK